MSLHVPDPIPPPPRTHRYKEPPIDEVSLEEFELFAVDRLRGEDVHSMLRHCKISLPDRTRLCFCGACGFSFAQSRCLFQSGGVAPSHNTHSLNHNNAPCAALKCIETSKVRWPKRGEEYDKTVRTALKTNIPLSVRRHCPHPHRNGMAMLRGWIATTVLFIVL